MIAESISYKEAIEALNEHIKLRPSIETIETQRSLGRVIAEDIYSPHDLPLNHTSLWDGYAVRYEDVKNANENNPIRLRLAKDLNQPFEEKLAYFILTGQYLPEGTDTVVALEDVIKDVNEIIIKTKIEKYKNVELKGADIKKGNLIIKKGSRIRAIDIGLLLEYKIKEVKVFKKPIVSIIATGSELAEEFIEGKKFPNYSKIIANMALALGCEVLELGIAEDDIDSIISKVKKGLEISDIVLITGGAAVGPYDLTREAVKRLPNLTFMIKRVKLSPGRVTGFAAVNGKPVVFLPGRLFSLINSFLVFALPIINRLSGIEEERTIEAHLTKDVFFEGSAVENTKILYLNTYFEKGKVKSEPIYPVGHRFSVLLSSNSYTILPEKMREIKEGEMIKVHPLPGFFFDHSGFSSPTSLTRKTM